jgi:exonuclease SbcC
VAEVALLAEKERHLLGVVEVARQRGLLKPLEACPLCGSLDHPYTDGHGSPPGEAEQLALSAGLRRARQAAEDARDAKNVELKQLQLQGFVAAEGRAEAAWEAHVGVLAEAAEAWREAARGAGLRDAEALDHDAARAALREAAAEGETMAEASAQRRRALREAVSQADEATRMAERAAHGRALAESRAAEAARVVGGAEETMQAAGLTLAREQAELGASVEARDAVLASVGLAPAEASVADLKARAERTPAYRKRLEDLAGIIDAQQAECARLAGVVETCEAAAIGQEDAAQARRLEAGRTAEDAAEASREIGGQAPDALDAELDATVRAATQRLAAAVQTRADALRQKEVDEATRRHEEAELASEDAALRAAEEALGQALRQGPDGGWETLAAATAARLGPEEAAALADQLEAAEQAVVGWRGRLQGAEEAAQGAAEEAVAAGWMEASMERVPPGPTAASSGAAPGSHAAAWPTRQQAEEDAVRAGQALAEAEARAEAEAIIGRTARGRLADDAAVREVHAGKQREVDRLQEEAARWEAIHRLVGTGNRNGDAFVRLAQAFQLEELVVRANARLATLSRRYRLAVRHEDGMPTLGFEVRDLEQAGRVRATSTLSGGESFIVALALALGLGDLQGVDMPIETVLIDEGFGTLDAHTLGQVLSALESLHATAGVQVGLISHVELLAERIAARVHVEPLGQGRSRVRIG